jgi:hypothetical protein
MYKCRLQGPILPQIGSVDMDRAQKSTFLTSIPHCSDADSPCQLPYHEIW